jgi:hypothetical protein
MTFLGSKICKIPMVFLVLVILVVNFNIPMKVHS